MDLQFFSSNRTSVQKSVLLSSVDPTKLRITESYLEQLSAGAMNDGMFTLHAPRVAPTDDQHWRMVTMADDDDETTHQHSSCLFRCLVNFEQMHGRNGMGARGCIWETGRKRQPLLNNHAMIEKRNDSLIKHAGYFP
jgi:hypothetical protein